MTEPPLRLPRLQYHRIPRGLLSGNKARLEESPASPVNWEMIHLAGVRPVGGLIEHIVDTERGTEATAHHHRDSLTATLRDAGGPFLRIVQRTVASREDAERAIAGGWPSVLGHQAVKADGVPVFAFCCWPHREGTLGFQALVTIVDGKLRLSPASLYLRGLDFKPEAVH